ARHRCSRTGAIFNDHRVSSRFSLMSRKASLGGCATRQQIPVLSDLRIAHHGTAGRCTAAFLSLAPVTADSAQERSVGRRRPCKGSEKKAPGGCRGFKAMRDTLEGGKSLGSPTIIQKRESRNQKRRAAAVPEQCPQAFEETD